MFRVPENTVLRRAALTSLLLLTTTVAACGGDDTSGGASSASASTPPVATEPAAPVDPKAGVVANSGLKVDTESKSSDTPETKASKRKASDAKISAAALKKEAGAALKALKAAGLDAEDSAPFGEAKYAVKVGKTTALFYRSESAAAGDFASYGQLLEGRPGFARTARDGHRGYLANSRKKLTTDDLKTFRAVRVAIEDGV